ncbi:MAG: protein tyrosine phosphatase family protein [Parachlamydiaceae bacterium]
MKEFTLNDLKAFEAIPSELPFCEKYYDVHRPDHCSVALNHGHKNLENFWGFPYDHNMIRSIPLYINASPMEIGNHRYIAAQGPRENTQEEFWQMVWKENATLIVSVTNERELWKGKEQMKFHRFWPDAQPITKGEYTIALEDVSLIKEWDDGRNEKLRSRKLTLSSGGIRKNVHHLHLENWVDNGVVHPESLVALTHAIDNFKSDGSIVVHCAAGIGRTGTVIAFHSLLHDLYAKKPLNPIDRIKEMRSLRWGAVVAAEEQYSLIIDALKHVLKD